MIKSYIKLDGTVYSYETDLLNFQQKQRFWNIVNVTDNEKDCWKWKSYLNNPNGYGYFYVQDKEMLGPGKNMLAHRVAFIITFGMKNESNYICHRCDNLKCCNPNHLFEGTAQDNTVDMYQKGRGKLGKTYKLMQIKEKEEDDVTWDLTLPSKRTTK